MKNDKWQIPMEAQVTRTSIKDTGLLQLEYRSPLQIPALAARLIE